MTYLFFDTETTGLPDFKKSKTWEGQPRICQLGAIVTDTEGRVKAELNILVKPQGWEIPIAATEIHGITQEDALKYGLSIRGVLSIFNRLMARAERHIAHNISFDHYMITREAIACELNPQDFDLNGYCTMIESRDIVKLPPTEKMLKCGFTNFKSPNLQELYKHFFDCEFEGAHDAMADVRACRDVFFKLWEFSEVAA